VGWREDLQNRLNPRSRAGPASEPACPECAAQRTIRTIDRGLYCPACGHLWTGNVARVWRAYAPVADSQSPPLCPQCALAMTYEDVARQPGPTAGGDVAAARLHAGYYRRAHCFHCDHVVEPPTKYDEH
jgi:hypothetical protein